MIERALAVIPWRAGDIQRERNADYVRTVLGRRSIAFSSVDADPGAPFSRAASKNRGITSAVDLGYDAVIFHDADMLLSSDDAYEALVCEAITSGRLVIGFTDYHALTRPATAAAIRDARLDQCARAATLTGFSVGGVIAITTTALMEAGGYDERFRGWGCEDFAFNIACQTVLGPTIRMPGPAYHLWHEHSSATQSDDDERWNADLLARYNRITGPEDLRALREENPDGMS